MFSIDPSIIEDFYTNYEQVRTLTDITSETDPEEDPYKSLYQARDILEKNLLPSPIANTDILTKVSLNYQLAINYKLSNEIATARNILETKCLKTLEDYEKTELERGETFSSTVDSQTQTQIKQNPILCSTALIKVHILQDLAITQTADPEKSLNNLLKAKTIVDSLCQAKNSYFIDEKLIRKTTEVIAIDQRKKRIDSALLQTVFCLGQAYQNMNDSENSSKFIIKTLQLQYTQNQYNNKKWALDAAAISQYFITNGHFLQAAHCLQCSEGCISLAKFASQQKKQILGLWSTGPNI